MSERELITKTQMGKTKKGEPQAELFGNNPKFSYPVLYLRDLSLLAEVNINPNTLTADPVHLRYWAHYDLSERTNGKGNPYKDILYLEAIDRPATSTSTDTSALLQELRAIRQLLEQLLAPSHQPPAAPAPSSDPVGATPRGRPATDVPPAKLNENDARLQFYELAGPAIANEKIAVLAINDLVKATNGSGWNEALTQLQGVLDAR